MIERVRTYLSFVRFGHSVFALPFALGGALLAARDHPVTWPTVAWILVAMVAARSAAMGFNRLADAKYDALNPRTADRELPITSPISSHDRPWYSRSTRQILYRGGSSCRT